MFSDDHIYEGHRLIENYDYVTTLGKIKSLYEGLDPHTGRAYLH